MHLICGMSAGKAELFWHWQILVCGMACSFWSLLCLQLGRRS